MPLGNVWTGQNFQCTSQIGFLAFGTVYPRTVSFDPIVRTPSLWHPLIRAFAVVHFAWGRDHVLWRLDPQPRLQPTNRGRSSLRDFSRARMAARHNRELRPIPT